MTTTRLPKHWEEMTTYRSYYRVYGPLRLKVIYSSSSQTFTVQLVAAFDCIVKEIYRNYQPDVGDTDAELLRRFDYEVKKVIRSWL